MDTRTTIENLMAPYIAEQATGCRGAGSYLEYAHSHGYPHVEVIDWTSSAGDWSFLVSKDGNEWYVMYQSNNYPRAGFSHQIDTEGLVFFGTAEEALADVCEFYT